MLLLGILPTCLELYGNKWMLTLWSQKFLSQAGNINITLYDPICGSYTVNNLMVRSSDAWWFHAVPFFPKQRAYFVHFRALWLRKWLYNKCSSASKLTLEYYIVKTFCSSIALGDCHALLIAHAVPFMYKKLWAPRHCVPAPFEL